MDIQLHHDLDLIGSPASPLEALAEMARRDLYFYDAFAPDFNAAHPQFRKVGVIVARDEAHKAMYFYFEKENTAPSAYSLPVFDNGGLLGKQVIWDKDVASRHWLDLCDPSAAIAVPQEAFEEVSFAMSQQLRQAIARLNARVNKPRRPHPSQPHIDLIKTTTPINIYERKQRRTKR